jgi:plastocyanin
MSRGARIGAAGVAAVVLGLAVSPALAATREVQVGSFFFEDATMGDGEITVATGDRITFRFQSGQGNHTAQVDGQFNSGNKEAGETFTTSPLLMAGTFTLYCTYHRSSGHVTRLVVGGQAPTASPTPKPPPPPPTSAPTRKPVPTAKPTTARPTPSPVRTTAKATPTRTPMARTSATVTPRPTSFAASPTASPLTIATTAAEQGDRSSGLRIGAFVVLGLIPLSLVAAWYFRRDR